MPKDSSKKKLEKSSAGKTIEKNKIPKKKLSDSAKNNAEIEGVVNAIIDDEKWQSTVVMFIFESQTLCSYMLEYFTDFSENITVVTQDDISNKKEEKSKGKNRKNSARSTSKGSKKSERNKSSKRKSKEIKSEETENLNEKSDCLNNCLAIKKLILNLRNVDIDNNMKLDEKTVEDEVIIEKNHFYINRFIALWGFLDALIPEILLTLNVKVKAIINVRNIVSTDNVLGSSIRKSSVTVKSKRKPSLKSRMGSLKENFNNEYANYMDKFNSFIRKPDYLEEVKDLIFLNFSLDNWSINKKGSGLKFKSDIMKIFSKIEGAWNKYKQYKEIMTVQKVPLCHEVLRLEDASIYTTLVSMIPLECADIAIILHCLCEQISWWNENSTYSKEKIDSLHDNHSSENIIMVPKPFKNVTPILIKHKDDIKYNTFHLDLPEFNFKQICMSMFFKLPIYNLWDRYPPHPESVKNWYDFQLHKLQGCSDSNSFKLDKLCFTYLNYSLIDIFIFKTYKYLNSNDSEIAVSNLKDIKQQNLLLSNEEQVQDKTSDLFIKEIICQILHKVPLMSLYELCSDTAQPVAYFSTQTSEKQSVTETVNLNQHKCGPLNKSLDKSLLKNKKLSKEKKLDTLLSFLFCSEFESLFTEIKNCNSLENCRLDKYEFIEELNADQLCQCFYEAFHKFCFVNYDYFPVTDSLMLWFNNGVYDQEISSSYSYSVLETPLGFRDFYEHKLKENINMSENDEAFIEFDTGENIETKKEGSSTEVSETPDVEFLVGEDKGEQLTEVSFKPEITYDLGSLRIEFIESFSNFFSLDSSSVMVKRTNYLKGKSNTTVQVSKNNVVLKYELDPESSSELFELFIDVNDELKLNCVFNWDYLPEKSFIQRVGTEFEDNFNKIENDSLKLNCRPSISLPSGLLIEVVQTNSSFQPFYVRQRYLGKGPNCSTIWEEAYRCYLSNGLILIFQTDGTVDIFNNNGTIVKCHSIEPMKPEDMFDEEGKFTKNVTAGPQEIELDTVQQKEGYTKKQGTKSSQKKKGKPKDELRSPDVERETTKKSKKTKANKESVFVTENQEETIIEKKSPDEMFPLYKINNHSVLSWDGELKYFEAGNCIESKKLFNLRSAFDVVSHELYWQRSDGMTSLQTSEKLVMHFPNGTKTITTTEDSTEVYLDNDFVRVQERDDSLEGEKPNFEIIDDKLSSNEFHFSINTFEENSLEENSFVLIKTNFLMDHANYARVEFFNDECKLKITLSGNRWVVIDKSGFFSFRCGNSEKITLQNNSLLFQANVLIGSLSESRTSIFFEKCGSIPKVFSQTVDSFGNLFSVDDRGNTSYSPLQSEEESKQQSHFSYSTQLRTIAERLFVLKRDLTGFEIIKETEQADIISSNFNMQVVKTPLLKDNKSIYSVYVQSPIIKNKSEKYLISGIGNEKNKPTLIKRKDLIKLQKMPKNIWFCPEMSTVTISTGESSGSMQQLESLKAIMTTKMLKISKNYFTLLSIVSKSLEKYIQINKEIYQKYLCLFPEETRNEEELLECEKNKEDFLGSKSYYLEDNLPVVITDMGGPKDSETSRNILEIFSPSVSKENNLIAS